VGASGCSAACCERADYRVDTRDPMQIRTRSATSDDADWLADAFIRAMRDAIAAERGSCDVEREAAQFHAQLRIADTRVIQVEGEDVGFLTVRNLGPKLFELHTLCIEPGRQGAGLGTRIMREVMADARAAGAAVELYVLKSNRRAARFYTRLGFAVSATSTHHNRMRWPIPRDV
jgi:ribosomal protein S18 acetylase RimI-like enzyme